MKIYKYINNKGFTTAEIIISITIIILFTAIITSAFYNYYISVQSKNRKTIATNIIIDIIENVEMMEYEEISQDIVNTLIQTLKDNGTIQNGYSVMATLIKYNEIEGNEDKKDLIKILTVKVEYTVSNKQEKNEVRRLIIKK